MQTRASTGRKLPNFLSAHADPSTWRDGDVVARTPWLLMSSVERKLAANYTAGPNFRLGMLPCARYHVLLQNRVKERIFLIECFHFKTENNTSYRTINENIARYNVTIPWDPLFRSPHYTETRLTTSSHPVHLPSNCILKTLQVLNESTSRTCLNTNSNLTAGTYYRVNPPIDNP